jgi:hypothetical protein
MLSKSNKGEVNSWGATPNPAKGIIPFEPELTPIKSFYVIWARRHRPMWAWQLHYFPKK